MAKSKVKKSSTEQKKSSSFSALGGLFDNYQLEDRGGYITQEFQDYGYRLAVELGDLKHKSLYIRMAKQQPRALLERALSFVSDAPNVKSKAKLFMWKFKQLREEKNKSEKSDLTSPAKSSSSRKSGETSDSD